MTIMILFHQSHYRNFKHFYLYHVCKHLKTDFPKKVSYNRFVELQKSVLVHLCCFFRTLKGEKTGIYFIDSTSIDICNTKRERQKILVRSNILCIGLFFNFATNVMSGIISYCFQPKKPSLNLNLRDISFA